MYSESDIEAAIASGAITPMAAAALRDSVAHARAAPLVDEESFRLVTGFNDIFVTIAAILLLVAVGWIGANIGTALFNHPGGASFGNEGGPFAMGRQFGGPVVLAGLFVAGTSWGLAEYFTRIRHMALPSILLLGTFVYAVAAALVGIGMTIVGETGPRGFAAVCAVAALLTAGAAWTHWRRFHVPITIAALTGALVTTVLALMFAIVPGAIAASLWFTLAAGIAVFAFAMWWDMADPMRLTRRSDVAFWLHLSAAPMIAHPIFNLLGVLGGEPSVGRALVVIALYLLFGIVALAVDRRALLVSGLVYVLYALAGLFRQAGAVGLNMALTALVIGSALLMLSAFWQVARRMVVARLSPAVRARLPAIDRPVVVTPRPA